MTRPTLAAVCLLGLLGTAAGQDVLPYGLPKPLGGPIVGPDGRVRTGLDAHPVGSPWSGGVDVGATGSLGNTDTLKVRAGLDVRYDSPDDVMIFNVMYILNRANHGELENKGFVLLRNEMQIEGAIGWYAQGQLEYDEFRVIDLRIASHSGLNYVFAEDAEQTLKLRAGAGVARETGGPTSDWVPEGQAGFDYEYRLTNRTKFTVFGDYYPDLEDLKHYRVRVRASFDILLDPEANILLRIGAFDRYDSNPRGSKPNDLDYFATLYFRF
jgi:hypothetical protein